MIVSLSVLRRTFACISLSGLILARAAAAGQGLIPPLSETDSSAVPFAFDGPPMPVPPSVFARDAEGHVTIRAVRLTAPIRLDGQLDDAIYASVPPLSDYFIQIEPKPAASSTQKTELWLFFDDKNVYVTCRCWEDHPEEMIANDMRRDHSNIGQNDHVAFAFDTSYDRRNGMLFAATPLGARFDAAMANERTIMSDYNPIWDVAVGRFEGGWVMEAAVPFKSLRYRSGRAQIWGFNALRNNRWKNEISFLMPMPSSRGPGAITMLSRAATIVGLEAPPPSMNLDIKPHAIADLTSDLMSLPRVSNDMSANVGLDVKYGVTENVTADFTYNTDFAQVEADEQQINLTRFSLFFPEKREFFLENQGIFSFGGIVSSGTMAGTTDAPVLFYSRRVGLTQGRVVPIEAGGRLTGRVGRFTLGIVDIHTDKEPVSGARSTNFSVVRIKRDILRRSSVGLIFTGRSVREHGAGSTQTYGVDGSFTFLTDLNIHTYWARTRADGLTGEDASYRAQLDYPGDRYGVQLEHLYVGDNFNPEVGFLRRDDMRRSFGQVRFSPRPQSIEAVRKFSWIGSMTYIEDGAGRLETRELDGEFAIDFQTSDRLSVSYAGTYEFLPQAFRIAPDVTLPAGGYDFAAVRTAFNFGQQRRLNGSVSFEHGAFYSGQRTVLGVSKGRLLITPQFSVEPTFSLNWVDLADGSFATRLVGSRVTYTMTPMMFVSALLQYNSGTNALATNARLRWEYKPGSELFVVYNEQRDARARAFPDLANRAFIIKVNRLFRF